MNSRDEATWVSLDGTLVSAKEDGDDLKLEMQQGLKRFVAHLPAKSHQASRWVSGSRMKLTGVFTSTGSRLDRQRLSSFEIWLNSPTDVVLMALPPSWTLRRLTILVAVLIAVLGLAFAWIQTLRRQVEVRTLRLSREISERERAEHGRAIEAERSRIARDIHDDVGASLTKISKLTELMIQEQPPSAVTGAHTVTIAQTARDTIQAMDEIVWAVNPKNDTLEEVADYLVHFTEEFIRPTDATCVLDVPLRLPDIAVAAEVRHNLLMVVKEALNNAVKHGAPRQVKLRLEVVDDWLRVQIADDGRGFASDGAISLGSGLENMRKRVAAVNGDLELKSEPGHGTTVRLQIPLKNKATLVRDSVVSEGNRCRKLV